MSSATADLPRSAIDPRAFRNALGAFTTGVTVVTTRDGGGRDVGLTVNSFNSVSLDPPLVLWSLARNSASLPAFLAAEHFAVHILAADQEPLSNRFAQRGADKFAGLALERGAGGVPLLPGCAARFACRTAFRHEGGDHEIFVGEVLAFEAFERAPLVFHKGGYAVAVKKRRPADAATAGPGTEAPEASISRDALVYLLGSAHAMLLAQMRPALAARALSDDDYFVLNILSVGLPRSVAELDALMQLAGRRVPPERLDALAARALVRLAGDGSGWLLAEAGSRAMLEMAAIAKAAEEDALQQIDYSEAHLLKHLLRRVIRNTVRRDQPALWPVAV
jgi:3-hydroxy-9,10-secoandrosta-1,3,5(10)-triene-9,17-dione monooxygenase reductase component